MISAPAHISDLLARNAESVCQHLLPGGKRKGHEWCVGSPDGEDGESCKIRLTGDRAGLWSDFAQGGDVGGDLLDLWCHAKGMGVKDAMEDASGWLGIEIPDFQGHTKRSYSRPARPPCVVPTKPAAAKARMWLTEERKISDESIGAYKVAVQKGDTVVFPYLRDGELIHVKFRGLPKKFWSSADTEPSLFGWQAIPENARSVIICEGEMDALAWHTLGYPALSMPFGTGTGEKQNWIEHEFDHLARFDTILLSVDMDDAGQDAISEIVDRLGRWRVKVIELPFKDANEALMEGISPGKIRECVADAKNLDPRELRNAADYLDEVIKHFYPPPGQDYGIDLPWEACAGRVKLRMGEVSIVAGYNGHGKSEAAGHMSLEAIAHGTRACIASLEFRPHKWLARLDRQVSCDSQPEISYLHRIHEWYRDKLWVFDVAGIAKVERILEVFEYAHRRYGCRLFVLDNFSKCGIAEDDFNTQKAAIERMTEFAIEFDIHLMVVAHNRKGLSDASTGGKLDVKGTGAITDLVDTVISWWRNRPKEKKLERERDSEKRNELMKKPDAIATVEKQRNGDGEEPTIMLWFDRQSHHFLDSRHATSRKYLP